MELKHIKFKWPQTYWGFPVAKDVGSDEGVISQRVRKWKKRGVALLMAMFITAVMILFASDLIVTSQVNLELGVANRDNVKAEYMAKSALSLSIFLLSIDYAIDAYMLTQMKTPATDGLGDVWSMLNGMPIGGETADMIGAIQEDFKLNAVMDEKVIDQLKLFDGVFSLNVTDESRKINVNYCAKGFCNEVLLMLEALFSCPVEKQYLASKKINPKELAYKIKDYVDFDSKASAESGVTDENEPYQEREVPYKAKNAPFDSLDELRMVDGWDEDMNTIFSKYLTVFPIKSKEADRVKLNINTIDRSLLVCLFPDSKANCGEKFAIAMKNRDTEKESLTSGGDINTLLQDLMCYKKEPGGTPGQEAPEDKTKWFDQQSNVFRVEAKGTVGKQEKTLEAVIERMMPDPAEKIETSYKILYWRLI